MDATSNPLVSCIMPTYNRRRFVKQAIKYFLRQDYPNKELVVLDDGTDGIEDLVPSDDRIRYFRLPAKLTLGAKLNIGCEYAKGTIVAHWDDDDWYAPGRLRYQIDSLIRDGTDVCGINILIYYDLCTKRGYQYVYPPDQRTWLSGSSLCYRKELWTENRFREIDVGMDGLFVWALPSERITLLKDSRFFVFMIHEKNGSPKRTDGAWWHSYCVEKIRQILDSDWKFYNGLPESTSPRTHTEIESVHESKKDKSLGSTKNIFACLVHESSECIVDLVRNLKYHDPPSIILLYNGSKNPELLQDHFPYERYGVVRHPAVHPMTWGYLHQFALDCMEFALDNFSFDILTIVDSDQLGVRSGYSNYIAKFVSGEPGVGMLGSSSQPQPYTTKVAPAVDALKEIELWRPFLQRFSQGKSKFVHWTFWPSTVFTRDACLDLVRLFKRDSQLQSIMSQTRIWATEEVILPTIVSLLGYKIAINPCSYDYVKYRTSYSLQQVEAAFYRPEVFWIHPIERHYDCPVRKHIREQFDHYVRSDLLEHKSPLPEENAVNNLLLTLPIMSVMKKIEGWLEEDEADLLISVTSRTLTDLPKPHIIIEVGSYCGRSTVVLGKVVQAISQDSKIYAIDPHQGIVGALDQGIKKGVPTIEKFKQTITQSGLTNIVNLIPHFSYEVHWDKPISLILIDGLHDYVNVARDFFHFEPWVCNGGYIAFHDYADYYPGVQAFVNEVLASGHFRKFHCVRSMMVIQKTRSAVK